MHLNIEQGLWLLSWTPSLLTWGIHPLIVGYLLSFLMWACFKYIGNLQTFAQGLVLAVPYAGTQLKHAVPHYTFVSSHFWNFCKAWVPLHCVGICMLLCEANLWIWAGSHHFKCMNWHLPSYTSSPPCLIFLLGVLAFSLSLAPKIICESPQLSARPPFMHKHPSYLC